MRRDAENFLKVLSAVFQDKRKELCQVNAEQLMEDAERQLLLPLFLVGYEKYGLSAETKWKKKAAAEVGEQMLHSIIFADLYQKMIDAGFHPVVVKGIVCRHTYGQWSDYRASSDEDLYIHQDELTRLAAFLKKEGYTSEQWELLDYPKATQEYGFDHSSGHLHLELHTGWFGDIGKRSDAFNALFEDADEHLMQMEIDGVVYTTLSHTMHYLYLFFHLAKHFSGSGVGIRQAVDLVMYEKMFGSEIDDERVEKAISSYGMKRLYQDVVRLGRHIVYGEAINRAAEELVEDSLHSGIYGNDTEAHFRSGVFLTGESQKNGLFRKMYVIFPPYRKMKLGYPYLVKKPYLLPVSWFHRMYRILCEYGGRKMVAESYRIARERIKLMKRYGFIDER